MKKISKSDCPEPLNFYLKSNPHEKWETFKDEEREGFKDVQKTIRNDQGGICAYCENKMEIFHGKGKDDFRIEHFHPKKRPPLPPPNWGLDWNNLLGVCTGGNERYVGNTSLFTAPDFSCDVPKQDKDLTTQILNPLRDIPSTPPIFKYNEDGEMFVDEERCPPDLIEKAKNTIQQLNLSPKKGKSSTPRLIKFRKKTIDKLRDQLMEITNSGASYEEAIDCLSAVYFPAPDADTNLPAFFSCIRWYLDSAAENQLAQIGYFDT